MCVLLCMIGSQIGIPQVDRTVNKIEFAEFTEDIKRALL